MSYRPTWESLRTHGLPEWIARARFGIWAHWGPQSVAQSGDWYGRHLYGMQPVSADWERKRADRQSAYHRARFGSPTTFGYKDLLPLWRAERFDPDALVDRFQRAGARYIMSMGVHCDNVALWDSAVQPWNSARIGPERDILGAWERAAREAGLPFGISLHNQWTWRWLDVAHGRDPETGEPYDGRLTRADGAGLWWDGLDPWDLYLPPRAHGSPASPAWVDRFYRMAWEATERYRPDLVYLDDQRMPFDEGSEVRAEPPSTRGLEYLARYYSAARDWDLPHAHGIAAIKNVPAQDRTAVLLDSERRQRDTLDPIVWQFDTSDGEWFDNLDDDPMFHPRKDARQVVHTLADVVSKNGALLLNVPQRADGTLDERSELLLDELTAWMDVCAEAIHDTVPWSRYGEGPTQRPETTEYNERDLPYTPADIRFTTAGDALYAILLAWPQDGRATVTSLATGAGHERAVHSVELLGHGPLRWHRDDRGLHVDLPDSAPTRHAAVLRIR